MKGQAWLLTQLYLLEKSTYLLHENASPMFMVCVLLWIQKNNTYLTLWITLAKMIISEILFPKLFEAQYIVILSFGSKIFKPIKMCYKTQLIKRQGTDWNIYISYFFLHFLSRQVYSWQIPGCVVIVLSEKVYFSFSFKG